MTIPKAWQWADCATSDGCPCCDTLISVRHVAGPALVASAPKPSCSCKTTDNCCDGCQPRNESASCEADAIECTDDVCRSGVCAPVLKPGFCLIDGACHADRSEKSIHGCIYCDARSNPRAWSKRAPGTTCDDGLFCNGIDHCGSDSQSGVCVPRNEDPCETSDDPCRRCDEASDSCINAVDVTWYDAKSNLSWDREATVTTGWQHADSKCSELVLCGHDDWRLPKIEELRTLVRGCPATATGGSCRVGASCQATTCGTNCGGCAVNGGPNRGGYLPNELDSSIAPMLSSSFATDDAQYVWLMNPAAASVSLIFANQGGWNARCVRNGR